MTRKEFIEKLRSEISKLPQEEIDAAIEYYEEYFDEAGKENEQEVLEHLGNPKKVAGQIKSEYAVRLFDEDDKPTVKKGLSAAWYVVIGICSAPVSIPLAVALGALVIAIFVALIGCVASVFAAIIGCFVAAVAFIVFGFMAVPVAVPTALLFLGIGIGTLGFMAAMGVLLAMGVKAGTSAMVSAARRHNDRRRIKKMVDLNEQKKWRYKDEMTGEEGGGKDE